MKVSRCSHSLSAETWSRPVLQWITWLNFLFDSVWQVKLIMWLFLNRCWLKTKLDFTEKLVWQVFLTGCLQTNLFHEARSAGYSSTNAFSALLPRLRNGTSSGWWRNKLTWISRHRVYHAHADICWLALNRYVVAAELEMFHSVSWLMKNVLMSFDANRRSLHVVLLSCVRNRRLVPVFKSRKHWTTMKLWSSCYWCGCSEFCSNMRSMSVMVLFLSQACDLSFFNLSHVHAL